MIVISAIFLVAICTTQAQSDYKIALDLIAEAPNAVWSNGAGRLLFGMDEEKVREDSQGFVTYRAHMVLEDGKSYPQVLETHPRWDTHNPDRGSPGMIRGEYYVPSLKVGQRFTALVGFIMPVGSPNTNGVEIRIYFNNSLVYRHIKPYTEKLLRVDEDLSPYAGNPGVLTIEVYTNGDSTQDWLSWVEAYIGMP